MRVRSMIVASFSASGAIYARTSVVILVNGLTNAVYVVGLLANRETCVITSSFITTTIRSNANWTTATKHSISWAISRPITMLLTNSLSPILLLA